MDPSVFVSLEKCNPLLPRIKGIFIPILAVAVAAELYLAWKSVPLIGYYCTIKYYLAIISLTYFAVARIEEACSVRKMNMLLEKTFGKQ